MRVIDSHIHFPENRIIDDGSGASPLDAVPSTGYTSGRNAEAQQGFTALKAEDGAGRALHAHPGRHALRHAAWLEGEKARWEASWNFPRSTAVGAPDAERLWAEEFGKHPELSSVVFVTAGSNDYASGLCARHPGRFYGYAHHDPCLPDAPERLEKALRDGGLRGYKILGPKVEKPISDRSFDPLWEIAQAYGVPVLIHFGIMGAAGGIASHINMNPMAIHDAAKRFPGVPFIVPHFGTGYLFEMLNLAWSCPNIYVDSSGSNQWMRWVPFEVTLESLFRKFRETIGASRILFGTDSSWFPRGFARQYLEAQVRAMGDVGYSESERDAVLYRNTAFLLGIEDDATGSSPGSSGSGTGDRT